MAPRLHQSAAGVASSKPLSSMFREHRVKLLKVRGVRSVLRCGKEVRNVQERKLW